MSWNIENRALIEVNTDPQRRCYNGAHAKSELQWTPWTTLEVAVVDEEINERLRFWRELNDFAISERGESARKEFRGVMNQ